MSDMKKMPRPKGPPSVKRTIRIPLELHELMLKNHIRLSDFVRSKLRNFLDSTTANVSVMYLAWIEMRSEGDYEFKSDLSWLMGRYTLGRSEASSFLTQFKEMWAFTRGRARQKTRVKRR